MNEMRIPLMQTERRLQMLKALSDESRLRLMLLIFSQKSLCVCELVDAVNLPQPTISRQLNILKQAGLVDSERRGKWMHYGLKSELEPWLQELLITSLPLTASIIEQKSNWCLTEKEG